MIVPGGFGSRGTEGKILALQFCRENKKPMLGICFGMQLAVIEFCRNILGKTKMTSEELSHGDDPANWAVIHMPEISLDELGGTMRLGSRLSKFINKDCTTYKLYGGKRHFFERHRHRYEINPKIVPSCEKKGLMFVAIGAERQGSMNIFVKHKERMEVCELKDHPFYIASQFHPELSSKFGKPNPLFTGFVYAANGTLDAYLEKKKMVGTPEKKPVPTKQA